MFTQGVSWLIKCSIKFQLIKVNETGLYLAAFLRSPFLKMGVTLAAFQSSGSVAWLMDAWHTSVKAGARFGAVSFRILTGMLSGSAALCACFVDD